MAEIYTRDANKNLNLKNCFCQNDLLWPSKMIMLIYYYMQDAS